MRVRDFPLVAYRSIDVYIYIYVVSLNNVIDTIYFVGVVSHAAMRLSSPNASVYIIDFFPPLLIKITKKTYDGIN